MDRDQGVGAKDISRIEEDALFKRIERAPTRGWIFICPGGRGNRFDVLPDPSTSSKSFGGVDYLLTAESGAEAIHFWAFMRTRS